MAVLKFYRGLEARYSSVTHADGIYFCTDTGKIMLNGKQYGGSSAKTVADVNADAEGSADGALTSAKSYADGLWVWKEFE